MSVCEKALAWSELVNGSMSFMHGGEVQAFEGVHEVLGEIAKMADIAVVSAGGSAEVQKDWEENGLDSYVEEFLTQEGERKTSLWRNFWSAVMTKTMCS
ncbi:MAG: hypothetical protein ACLR2E_06075 [Lachnospiraceae bacterium]